MMRFHRVVFLLGALYTSHCQGEVVELSDSNFEHQTQASTGATTGSWFIMFSSPSCSSCTELKPVFEELGQDEELYEKSIVLGAVDVSANTATPARFGIKSVPSMLFIHKGSVYRFDAERELEALKSFVLEDFANVKAEPIPEPESFMEELMRLFDADSRVVYLAFAMGSALLVTMAILAVALGASGRGKTKKD